MRIGRVGNEGHTVFSENFHSLKALTLDVVFSYNLGRVSCLTKKSLFRGSTIPFAMRKHLYILLAFEFTRRTKVWCHSNMNASIDFIATSILYRRHSTSIVICEDLQNKVQISFRVCHELKFTTHLKVCLCLIFHEGAWYEFHTIIFIQNSSFKNSLVGFEDTPVKNHTISSFERR